MRFSWPAQQSLHCGPHNEARRPIIPLRWSRRNLLDYVRLRWIGCERALPLHCRHWPVSLSPIEEMTPKKAHVVHSETLMKYGAPASIKNVLKQSGYCEGSATSKPQCKLLNQSELNGFINAADREASDDGTM